MKIAGFERRIISFFIDFALPLLLALLIMWHTFTRDYPWLGYILIGECLMAVFYVMLNSIMMLIFKGRSIGMFIVGSRLGSLNSDKLTFKQIFVRNLGLSVFPMVLVNIFFMLTVHTERSVFDRLSDTIVLDKQ